MSWPAKPSRWRSLLTSLISLVLVGALRLWSATWRTNDADIARLDALIAAGTPIILMAWHGKYLPLLPLLQGRRAMVFAAQSFRGEIIEKICRRLGYRVTLIPAHASGRAYGMVKASLLHTQTGAMVMDGPLGPYHVAKPGTIRLASETGHLLVPISVAGSANIVLKNRWDKREWPHLFARVALAVGEPVYIPAHLDAATLMRWQTSIGSMIEATDARAEAKLKTS